MIGNQMTCEEVDKVEEDLRKVESELERIGRIVCPANGGCCSWNYINASIENVQNAIYHAYKMR